MHSKKYQQYKFALFTLSICSASLLRIRGNAYSSLETELEEIKSSKNLKASGNNFLELISIISSRVFLVPYACVGVLFILFRLSGFVVISHYTATYFEFTNTSFDPLSTPIIIGAVRLMSSICLPLILRTMQKKTAFVTLGFASTAGMLSGKLFLNSYHNYNNNSEVHLLQWQCMLI